MGSALSRAVKVFISDAFFLGIMLFLLCSYLLFDVGKDLHEGKYLMAAVGVGLVVNIAVSYWRRWRHQVK